MVKPRCVVGQKSNLFLLVQSAVILLSVVRCRHRHTRTRNASQGTRTIRHTGLSTSPCLHVPRKQAASRSAIHIAVLWVHSSSQRSKVLRRVSVVPPRSNALQQTVHNTLAWLSSLLTQAFRERYAGHAVFLLERNTHVYICA